jgi:putative transposase
MSRKYKFHDKDGLYFVSFATVYWIDIFVRDQYFDEIVKSLNYCRKNKGMEIYGWCIMSIHVHLIFLGLRKVIQNWYWASLKNLLQNNWPKL